MDLNPERFSFVNDEDLLKIDCQFYSQDELKTNLSKYNKNSFSLFMLNIRSCRKNFSNMLSLLSDVFFKFSLIILIETWLIKDIDYLFDIDGYKDLNLYRNSHGGGIKILYQKSLKIKFVKGLTIRNEIMEVLTFYLTENNIKYLIIVVYRPPNGSHLNFIDMFFKENT